MDLSNYKQPELHKSTAPGNPRCQREALVSKFLDRLNGDRVKAGYPPYTYPRVAKMLKGYNDSQLYALYEDIKDAEKFGGLLKWKLNQNQQHTLPRGAQNDRRRAT